MKKFLVSILISGLVGCGAGADAVNHTPEVASAVKDSASCTPMRITSKSGTYDVEGCGDNSLDREYDAVAWFVTNIALPGSQEYRDLVGKSMVVILWDGKSNHSYAAQSRNVNDLVIEKLD